MLELFQIILSVPVQNPKCLSCRIKLYSFYKFGFTLKFMILVYPADLITFVSNSQGGRASDNINFKQNNLIQLLDRYDALMVDRGFPVDDERNEKCVTLIRQPFLKGKHQFSKSEVYSTD